MTAIAFHFGVAEPLTYLCRLLRKAVQSGARVAVRLPDAQTLDQADALLWNFSATDFLAHCSASSEDCVQKHSPVYLQLPGQAVPEGFSVLVNLASDLVPDFARCKRIIEIVSNDAVDRQDARRRWKEYAALGHPIQQHDLNGKEAAA